MRKLEGMNCLLSSFSATMFEDDALLGFFLYGSISDSIASKARRRLAVFFFCDLLVECSVKWVSDSGWADLNLLENRNDGWRVQGSIEVSSAFGSDDEATA